MGRRADDAREEPEEVERAQAGGTGHGLEVDRVVRPLVEPERGLDRPAPVPSRRMPSPRRSPGHDRDEAGGERERGLVEPDFARRVGRGLRELAQDDQLRERRHAAGPPDVVAGAERVDGGGVERPPTCTRRR